MKRATAILILTTLAALPACGKKSPPIVDGDLRYARAIVDKALHADTFEEYVSYMTERNRGPMIDSPDARHFWTTQREDGRVVWRITGVEVQGEKIKVETRRNVSPPDSVLRIPAHPEETLRVYFLVRENGEWKMDELAFGS